MGNKMTTVMRRNRKLQGLVSTALIGGSVLSSERGPGRDNMEGVVRKNTLKDPFYGCTLQINNLLDDKHVIVKEALSQNQSNLQDGDLIEIDNGGFSHWVVYIGDGNVVHLTVPTDENGSSGISGISGISGSGPGWDNKKGIVRKNKLKNLVEGHKWKINNSLDDKYTPKDAGYILVKASLLVNTKVDYNLLSNNCEHFATELRYGQGESRQVRKAGEAIATAGVGLGVVGLAVSAGGRKKKRRTRDD